MSRFAVIFDMDGVIFDTERLALQLWTAAAEECGIPEVVEQYHRFIGVTVVRTREILRELYGPDFSVADFEAAIRRHFERRYAREGLPVKPGAEEILRFLRQAGIPTALASSTLTATVTRELRDAGFLEYFTVVVGGDQATRSKPNPDIFLRAAELLGMEPASCWVIEDSFNGIRAAHAAGMHPLMVPDLLQPTEEIRNLAERVFPSLREAQAFLSTGDGSLCSQRTQRTVPCALGAPAFSRQLLGG
ncbi:MAG: HAD family phosphatase [Oscillospiraceae bacterium]|nr:HAD family phosphatase [Oscillospiraceae bacterium]